MLYKHMEDGQILTDMTFLMENYDNDYYNTEDMKGLLFEQMNDILELSASHGFEGNLWHTYLTYLLASHENAYSTSCEITGAIDGSLNQVALHDFEIFKELFDYDFRKMEEAFGVDCISMIKEYAGDSSHGNVFNKRISELIQRKYNLKIKKYTSGKKIAKDYGQEIFELMNEAYSPLYGYSPLTQRQINQYVKMYLPILDLRMVTLITDADDKLVCVGISMPSLAEALQKSHGRLLPLGWFYLLKALFMKRRAKMLDLLLVAVKPEYQNKGVNALLFSDLIPVYQKLGFIFAESNPELELNGKVQAQWDYFETQQHKRRRAFIKEIK